MPSRTKSAPAASRVGSSRRPSAACTASVPAARLRELVASALEELRSRSTPRYLENMSRFGITSSKPIGVSLKDIHVIAKRLGRSHDLAAALWETGWYEARLLTAFVDEPSKVTQEQMDRWCRAFDSWAVCDTLCFHLFDRAPHAWRMVARWSGKRDEFVKRAAFALLASLAFHDKKTGDAPFLDGLRRIESAATDERNFVKKGVNWALRGIGRRNSRLHAAAVKVARRLAAGKDAAPRWVGKDALRELTSPVVMKRIASRGRMAQK